MEPDDYADDLNIDIDEMLKKLDTNHEDKTTYNQRKIFGKDQGSNVTFFRPRARDVEIKVKMINDELTDAESKIMEERYFIPIEPAECSIKASELNN